MTKLGLSYTLPDVQRLADAGVFRPVRLSSQGVHGVTFVNFRAL
jgi:hypothetical protein